MQPVPISTSSRRLFGPTAESRSIPIPPNRCHYLPPSLLAAYTRHPSVPACMSACLLSDCISVSLALCFAGFQSYYLLFYLLAPCLSPRLFVFPVTERWTACLPICLPAARRLSARGRASRRFAPLKREWGDISRPVVQVPRAAPRIARSVVRLLPGQANGGMCRVSVKRGKNKT